MDDPPPGLDPWLLLDQAMAALLAANPPGAAFTQLESIEGARVGASALVACRAVLSVGELAGTVGTGGVKADEGVALYVL